MKTFGILLTVICSIVLIADIWVGIIAHYEYSKKYESYWSLAVKASSISKKIEGIDKFVEALEKSDLAGKYDALWLETPDNSWDQNFEALKSLQIRLHEIRGMDITSFQYQTALAQITQQEQNEASAMLTVFEGIWWKENHILLWHWIGGTQIITAFILLVAGGMIWATGDDY